MIAVPAFEIVDKDEMMIGGIVHIHAGHVWRLVVLACSRPLERRVWRVRSGIRHRFHIHARHGIVTHRRWCFVAQLRLCHGTGGAVRLLGMQAGAREYDQRAEEPLE